jgi:hypothetical protein
VGTAKERYEEIEKDAPRGFAQRLAYYERMDFPRGIELLLTSSIPGKTRLLNEGFSSLILWEVGKRGDSNMIRYLKQHGVENIDGAIASAILAHKNDFVREWIDTPLTDVRQLIRAATEGDNLEMLKLVAVRGTEPNRMPLRTNLTSAWYVHFRNLQGWTDIVAPNANLLKTHYILGFGAPQILDRTIPRYSVVTESLASEFSQPLPFTYDQLESIPMLDYLYLFDSHIVYILGGLSRNYQRLEWILEAAERQSQRLFEFHLQHSPKIDTWVKVLLPLLGDPLAEEVFKKAREILGPRWLIFVDPIRSKEQLNTILSFLPPGNFYLGNYYPIQPEAFEAWVDKVVSGGYDGIPPATLFVTENYPGGKARDPLSPFPRKEYPSFDFHRAILKLFKVSPIPTVADALRNQLLDVWNELSPRLTVKSPDSPQGLTNLYVLIRGAAIGGLNDLCEALAVQYPSKNGLVRSDNYPRINNLLDRTINGTPRNNITAIRPVIQNYLNLVSQADEALARDEPYLRERLSHLSVS